MFEKPNFDTEVETLDGNQESLVSETEQKIEELQKNATPENLARMNPEKRKVVFDKVKTLLLVAGILGLGYGASQFPILEQASNLAEGAQASAQQFIAGASLLVGVVGVIGAKIRDIVMKEKSSKLA